MCREEPKDLQKKKFLIFKAYGADGPVRNLLEKFLRKTVKYVGKSFICITCRTQILKYNKLSAEASDIRSQLLGSYVAVTTAGKRCREDHQSEDLSRLSPAKRFCRGASSDESQYVNQSNQSLELVHTVKYYTSSLASLVHYDVVPALCNGSILKVFKLLSTKYPLVIKKFVTLLLKEEGRKFDNVTDSIDLRRSDPSAVRTLDIKRQCETIKRLAPIFWEGLGSIASVRKDNEEKRLPYVVMAASILLKARNVKVNALQVANSLSLYNYGLSKEGFTYLAHFGVTSSYDTLQNRLSDAQRIVVADVKKWKNEAESSKFESSNTTEEHTKETLLSQSAGYSMAMDNVDYYIKVRNMTVNNKNEMKHYLQVWYYQKYINKNTLPAIHCHVLMRPYGQKLSVLPVRRRSRHKAETRAFK